MIECADGPTHTDSDEVTLDELVEMNQRLVLSGVREQSLAEETERKAARPDAVIAEHDRVGRALREERDRAQEHLDLVRTVSVTFDRSGAVTRINRRGGEVLGYETEAIVGKGWFDSFIPVEPREGALVTFASLLADEPDAVERSEWPVLNSSGEERLVCWHHAVLRDPAGRPSGVMSSGEDVTDERRSAELRDNFLRLASHELRTPLSALTGSVH